MKKVGNNKKSQRFKTANDSKLHGHDGKYFGILNMAIAYKQRNQKP